MYIECRIQDMGCRIPDTGFRIPDAGYLILDAGCRSGMLDTGFRNRIYREMNVLCSIFLFKRCDCFSRANKDDSFLRATII